jgi:hypothetical protein
MNARVFVLSNTSGARTGTPSRKKHCMRVNASARFSFYEGQFSNALRFENHDLEVDASENGDERE